MWVLSYGDDSVQSNNHLFPTPLSFLRHEKGLRQTEHVLVSKCDILCMVASLSMSPLPAFSRDSLLRSFLTLGNDDGYSNRS